MNADDIDPNDPDYFAKIHAQVEMWDREARRGLRIEVNKVLFLIHKRQFIYVFVSPI